MRVSKYGLNLAGTDQGSGGGGGGGDKRSFVLHTSSSNEFEDAPEQTPTQVPNHDKFLDEQTIMAF